MQIHTDAKIKTLGKCSAGELIYMRFAQGPAWSIVLDINAHGGSFWLLGRLTLKDEKIPYPSCLEMKKSLCCVSYGTEWGINPLIGEESYSGNRELTTAPGSLHCSNEGWLVCFKSASDGYFDDIYYNLVTGKIDDRPSQDAAPFRKWEVWERAEDIGGSGEALFTVEAYTSA